jgi:hypothetical protein
MLHFIAPKTSKSKSLKTMLGPCQNNFKIMYYVFFLYIILRYVPFVAVCCRWQFCTYFFDIFVLCAVMASVYELPDPCFCEIKIHIEKLE